jgi:hypothetical protein
MYLLSATEAVSPALNRTRDFLFRSFQWRTYLKLCAVGVVTEGFWNSANRSHGGGGSGGTVGASSLMNISPGTFTALVYAAVVALVLTVVLFYVVVRLRFSLFHCLAYQVRELTPGWRLYRAQAMRFFLLSIAVGLGYIAFAVVALSPFVPIVLRVFHQVQQTGNLDMRTILPIILPIVLQFIPVVMVLALLGVVIDVVMRDFMLPHMALENASTGDAWSAVLARFSSNKGAFFLYMLLRLLLPFVAMIGLFVVLIIPMILVFGIPGVMIAGLQALLVHATGAAWVAVKVLEIALGVLMFAMWLLLVIAVGGPLSIAVRNYALVFYGSRYEVLGDILFISPAMAPQRGPLPA